MKRVKRKETIRQYYTRSKKREEDFDPRDMVSSLPLDLKLRILAKLPAKSIVKFIFVSKHWSSIVRGKDLTELFISNASNRPSILFTYAENNIIEFHCCSQEEPSSGNRRTTLNQNPFMDTSTPVRGLICGQESSYHNACKMMICNPSTGQFVTLPTVKTKRRFPDTIFNFLGYDPVNDLYKVLSMTTNQCTMEEMYPPPAVSEEHQVFTLGARKKAWRMIECKHPHFPTDAVVCTELCRDGVLYYGAWNNFRERRSLIMSFNLTTEDFGVIKLPENVEIRDYHARLVNYQGKTAFVNVAYDSSNVDVWVLQDAKKQEWSKISVLLPPEIGLLQCMGTISTGELIFAPDCYYKPYFLFYCDLKGNNSRKVYMECVRGCTTGPFIPFLDHIESPMFL